MKEDKKITLTLRLYPVQALAVLHQCYEKKFITDKQFINKTDAATAAMSLNQDID